MLIERIGAASSTLVQSVLILPLFFHDERDLVFCFIRGGRRIEVGD